MSIVDCSESVGIRCTVWEIIDFEFCAVFYIPKTTKAVLPSRRQALGVLNSRGTTVSLCPRKTFNRIERLVTWSLKFSCDSRKAVLSVYEVRASIAHIISEVLARMLWKFIMEHSYRSKTFLRGKLFGYSSLYAWSSRSREDVLSGQVRESFALIYSGKHLSVKV